MEQTVTEAMLFPFLIESLRFVVLAYVMPDPAPHNLLLEHAWMHQVQANNDVIGKLLDDCTKGHYAD